MRDYNYLARISTIHIGMSTFKQQVVQLSNLSWAFVVAGIKVINKNNGLTRSSFFLKSIEDAIEDSLKIASQRPGNQIDFIVAVSLLVEQEWNAILPILIDWAGNDTIKLAILSMIKNQLDEATAHQVRVDAETPKASTSVAS